MRTLILWLLCIGVAYAEPIAVFSQGQLFVTLTNEPCALPAVINLPNRAVWIEKGETIEGCWRHSETFIMFYFADKTVLPLPTRAFRLAVGV